MTKMKSAIKWSMTVGEAHHHSPRCLNSTLFPPFLRERSCSIHHEQDQAETPSGIEPVRRKPEKDRDSSFSDYVTVCRNLADDLFNEDNFDLREGIQRKFEVLCKDDCERKDLTCEKLRDEFDEETRSFAEIATSELCAAFEVHDEDYQQWGEDFQDETERGEQKGETGSLDRCESFSSLSEIEEDPNTTDPYMSHELYTPYNRTLRPTHFKATGEYNEYTTTRLPRRPRSPIRRLLPGKFDLKVAYQQWDRRRRLSEKRRYLEETKDRISESIRRLSQHQVDEDVLITSVVLQAVCEQVTLTLMDATIDSDIHTFVNIAVIWALSELELLDRDMLSDERVLQPQDSRTFDWKQQDIIDVMGTGGMRKILMGVYRAPFSRNIHTTLHRRLPWPYVSPAHERGHTKFYPNVRERIDEKMSKEGEDRAPSTYVPDLTCFHLRELLDESYVAYKRKSRSLVLRSNWPPKTMEDLFLQIVSLM